MDREIMSKQVHESADLELTDGQLNQITGGSLNDLKCALQVFDAVWGVFGTLLRTQGDGITDMAQRS
jgi:hypothetical protein